MTATRRKRDDDSSYLNNNSQSSSDPFLLDASSMSQANSRCRKRRRTIIDAMQQVSLTTHPQVPHQILDHVVLADDNSQLSDEEEIMDDSSGPVLAGVSNNNNNNHTTTTTDTNRSSSRSSNNTIHTHILSDAELAQRKVMLELVFGRSTPTPPANPVDRRLEDLVRASLQQATSSENATTRDDMCLETAYAQPSKSDHGNGLLLPLRPRSNSLPSMELEDRDTGDAAMELS